VCKVRLTCYLNVAVIAFDWTWKTAHSLLTDTI